MLLSCNVYSSSRYLGLTCYCSFLVVDSGDELNEKDLLWSEQNLKKTAPLDDESEFECHESSQLPNEPPKKRSRSVSIVIYAVKL